ncbi:MAG: hypothetical protein H0V54_10260 [Chthoniobacterales bacterium]|nr:hypothetical protein [Chthoniobacterales bacterium]
MAGVSGDEHTGDVRLKMIVAHDLPVRRYFNQPLLAPSHGFCQIRFNQRFQVGHDPAQQGATAGFLCDGQSAEIGLAA